MALAAQRRPLVSQWARDKTVQSKPFGALKVVEGGREFLLTSGSYHHRPAKISITDNAHFTKANLRKSLQTGF
jgi:hypothetical protein